MTMRDDIERDGYVVARKLLSTNEIARLRDGLLEHFQHSWNTEGLGKHQPNAAVEIASIGWIFVCPAILSVFRELYGRDDLIFTGNCDAHMNMLSWWHKDTSEGQGGCFGGDYFSREDCRVYRAGIYLQDHESQHGLTVRMGSHRTHSLTSGVVETLHTRAGDVIFFDIRLTHAGQFADPLQALLLRLGRKLRRDSLAAACGDRYRRFFRRPSKLSIFFTFGTRSPDTDEYCEFELAAKKNRGFADSTYLPAALLADLSAASVEFHPAMARRGRSPPSREACISPASRAQ